MTYNGVGPFILSLILLSNASAFCQSVKQIILHVDVLGKKHPAIRYYHPIEGEYSMENPDVSLTEDYKDKFPGMLFVNPADFLNDSVQHIQANSLRYYVNAEELVYIDWRLGRDTSNEALVEEFREKADQLRNEKYAKLINDYFQPFFIKKHEVTNKEYREFVYWVRDSIFMEAIYASDSITDQEAFEMLYVPETYFDEDELGWVKSNPSDRSKNRELFYFNRNYDFRKEIGEKRLIPILEEFYLPLEKRWYHRRELDVKKFNYKYYSVDKAPLQNGDTVLLKDYSDRKTGFINEHVLNIYPDTTCWLKGNYYTNNDPMVNMYFWHPAYDNFPVVGISWEQAKAFCKWKEVVFNAENPEFQFSFEFDLPKTYEYEWAATGGYNQDVQQILQDRALITDLLTGSNEDETGRFHSLFITGQIPMMHKVYLPCDMSTQKGRKQFKKSIKYYFYETENSTVKEILFMRAAQNYLVNGIEFLSNNVSEWMNEDYINHYEDLFRAYINYNCFASTDYCEDQRNIDERMNHRNTKDGKLIMGSNWYDERYKNILGVNTGGIYPKAFKDKDSSYCTVGFRYVIRPR